MSDHIVKAYDEDLAALKTMLAQMGGLAEEQLDNAIDALARRDTALADRVIQNDEKIDVLEHQIEEKAILTIAKRQPMARDLREIMVAIRVSSDLERIGDLAKNTAKRTHAMSDQLPRKLDGRRHPHGRLAQEELKNILDAYARSDADKALEVWRSDEELDALYNSIFRELLTYMMEDPRNISLCTHLLFGAKNMERIGDHATNIAENIHYLVHGKPLAEGRVRRRTSPAPPPVEPQAFGRRGAMSASILVVEDEEPIQILLSYNLEAEGYRVRHTAEGEEVQRLIGEERPDLILLDWMLPGISGIEVCRVLRTKPETRDIPIIMLTARGEEAERVRGLATGADDYMVKPFSVPELLARIRTILRRAQPGCGGRPAQGRRHRARPQDQARDAAARATSRCRPPSSACSNT